MIFWIRPISDREKPPLICSLTGSSQNFAIIVALNMNVRRFVPIACIEEETVLTDSQCCWHLSQLNTTLSRLIMVYVVSSQRLQATGLSALPAR
jgi:hypothetical protein